MAPWRCRSIIVHNVKSCPALILGPTYGTVILKEVHHSNITVMCKQLCLWNCSNITVFLHTLRPPIIRGCKEIRFGVFNVSYEGLAGEIEAVGLQTFQYDLITHIINFDQSEVSALPPSCFYIQPVPIVNTEENIVVLKFIALELSALIKSPYDFLNKLPPLYRYSWENSLENSKVSAPNSNESSNFPLKRTDLIYLKKRIAKEINDT
ncbi:tubulin binding cofactor [Dictyocaulus viviparus]|uniref:Tubulin binding cofactor n=1 Tax=Dictyocaulus viviparus TaxID=29172 RepID=A0A0D8XIC7_DICVI|nr:tubulin binding cofactor [Dictyocaulus viviparus]